MFWYCYFFSLGCGWERVSVCEWDCRGGFWDGFLQCFFSTSSSVNDSPLSLLFKFSVISIASGCFSFLDVFDDNDDTGVFSIVVAVVPVVAVVILVVCFSGVGIGACFFQG